jgi:DNA processing protein
MNINDTNTQELRRLLTISRGASPCSQLARDLVLKTEQALLKKRVDPHLIDQDLSWLTQKNHHIISLNDPHYPALLREIPDPPALLFAIGNPDLLLTQQIAIVGSRNPTHSGRENAYLFAHQLCDQGLSVTSGLAMGVDTHAHRGAIVANGRTIACLGCGIDVIYPKQNRELYENIAEVGCIISEFALNTAPRPSYFPQRNRIISGLSLGTLVVEAAPKSGSLITARLAMEQNRDVFAIPGNINNPLTRGCHQLLKNGAKLVESYEDIVVEFPQIITQPILCERAIAGKQLDGKRHKLLEYIEHDGTPLEHIVDRSGWPAETVKCALMELVLAGRIKYELGGYYRV